METAKTTGQEPDGAIAEANRAAARGLLDALASLEETGTEPEGTSPRHMERLLGEALERRDLPADKVGRWVGFVQGVLCARGQLDVRAERDRTRPVFRSAYAAAGLEAPTVDVG